MRRDFVKSVFKELLDKSLIKADHSLLVVAGGNGKKIFLNLLVLQM